VDEFERAERDDRDLDRADEHEIARLDWAELHGEALVHPTLADAIRQAHFAKQRTARGTELIIDEEME
jgi:hypothetical protein